MRPDLTPKTAGRVLLIGDRATTCDLSAKLKVGAYSVRTAADRRSALRLMHSFRPEVITVEVGGVDNNASGPGGESICALLRAVAPTPILTIASERNRDLLIRTLDEGADDFIVWPATQLELLARTRALLRWNVPSASHEQQPIIRLGTVQIDLDARSVARQGTVVNLSPTEFDLLVALLRHYGGVAPRRSLLTEVWGSNVTGCEHYLRLYVGYLRRKLEEDPRRPSLILNERGIGYRLSPAAVT
jgi:two-component system KDP operon response regulator KdpE